MKLIFQKVTGAFSSLPLLFWRLQVNSQSETSIEDLFIPELFFDFLAVRRGKLVIDTGDHTITVSAGQQLLKSLFTHKLRLIYTLPLDLYGGRFPIQFAESYAEELPGQTLLQVEWLPTLPDTLEDFAARFSQAVEKRQTLPFDQSLLLPNGEASARLAQFSPRHQRRLIKKRYGISAKEMAAIQNLHAFLGRTCDFSDPNPRIIEYIDTDVFYDQPHLNRLFKKMTGLSPLEFFESRSILQENLMAASYNEG